MTIPTYDKFYGPLLEFLSDGEIHNSKETIHYCTQAFHLSEEDQQALLPSGKQTILSNRVGWARAYLKKAGLIETPFRGRYRITAKGKESVRSNALIDNEYLSQFQEFQEFWKGSSSVVSPLIQKCEEAENTKTPLELMNSAYKDINAQLADELMTNIMNQDPRFFEHLVMDLLEKMGYGGELAHHGEMTPQSGDQGIDGIIRQDALGFDKIYVQAKRWSEDNAVGNPAIQQFAGALMGKGANKGLFITTSRFSKAALEFVEKHMTAKIVLIDGKQLTDLMIKFNIGVSTIHTFEIKRVDTDYFNNNDE